MLERTLRGDSGIGAEEGRYSGSTVFKTSRSRNSS